MVEKWTNGIVGGRRSHWHVSKTRREMAVDASNRTLSLECFSLRELLNE